MGQSFCPETNFIYSVLWSNIDFEFFLRAGWLHKKGRVLDNRNIIIISITGKNEA
jgi:hypothetical protein